MGTGSLRTTLCETELYGDTPHFHERALSYQENFQPTVHVPEPELQYSLLKKKNLPLLIKKDFN